MKVFGRGFDSPHLHQNNIIDWELRGGQPKNQSLSKIISVFPEYTLYILFGSLEHLEKQTTPYIDNHTIEEISEKYLDNFKVEFPSSYETQRLSINLFYDFFKKDKILRLINIDDVSNFKKNRLKKVKPKTLNRNLSTLSSLFRFYIENYDNKFIAPIIKRVQELDSNPPKFYTERELNYIYNYDNKNAHVWKFIANTGLRISEFYNLKWEYVTNDDITIISSNENRTKSGKYRIIPLNKAAKDALQLFEKNDEFVAKRYKSVVSYKNRFARICRNIGLKNKSGVHCLRHTFASHLVFKDVSIRKIQKLLGHASVKTTEGYLHILKEELEKAVNKINL